MKKHAVHFSSNSDEWRTPPELFAALDKEFNFALDAASSDINALCPRHFTVRDDALKQNWSTGGRGAVWCNPPYSRGLQSAFIRKGWQESRDNGAVVVFLIPARPDTAVWQEIIFPYAAEIRFLKGRVRFVGADNGAPPSTPPKFNPRPPMKTKMTFAAEIVIRKNNNGYVAGFASKTTGTKVESFGKWYGSQMGYRPFRAAMAAAEARADKLNASLVQEVAHV